MFMHNRGRWYDAPRVYQIRVEDVRAEDSVMLGDRFYVVRSTDRTPVGMLVETGFRKGPTLYRFGTMLTVRLGYKHRRPKYARDPRSTRRTWYVVQRGGYYFAGKDGWTRNPEDAVTLTRDIAEDVARRHGGQARPESEIAASHDRRRARRRR